jgi:predicted alpha/beta-fold hydrolase
MRRDFLAGKSLRDEVGLGKLMAIKSVLAFDEEVTAPLNGFAGADDYYARCSASKFLRDIRTPTLVVMAGNDPWIPAESYDAVDWAGLRDVTLAMPKGGGHVGFHGLRSQTPWHDLKIGALFERLAG